MSNRSAKDLLLVIDMQNVYADGGAWCCPNAEKAAKRIKELLQQNEDCFDVIFTRFLASENPKGIWNRYNEENAQINADEHANAMMSVLSEESKKYPLFTKSVYSSLEISQVREASAKARRVVVAGVVAECCVLATVLALVDEGDYVIYLTDGVAGINEETEASVECILSGLEPLHVQRMTVSEYSKEIKKGEKNEQYL